MAPSAESAATPVTRNRLLAALPPDILAALWPRLEAVELPESYLWNNINGTNYLTNIKN